MKNWVTFNAEGNITQTFTGGGFLKQPKTVAENIPNRITTVGDAEAALAKNEHAYPEDEASKNIQREVLCRKELPNIPPGYYLLFLLLVSVRVGD